MQLKKLRVGVWVPSNYEPKSGGGYSYYAYLTDELNRYQFADAEIVFISFNPDINKIPFENRYSVKSKIRYNIFERIFIKLKQDPFGTIKSKRKKLKAELNEVIDIIYYLVPTFTLGENSIDNFPFVCTLWDLSHTSSYSFPELSMNGVFEYRKPHLDKIVYKALKVFTESEAGKSDAVKYLNLSPNRVGVIPLFPSDIVTEICSEEKPEGINENDFFIHYPAQFWAHKNHYNLILAFKKILNTYPSLKLILCGSDKGNKEYILDLISQYKLNDQVITLGFVKNEELKWIYKHSAGLVMPTFLGPTNMPVVEAAELDCPVACSDFDGHREQLGNYGYYFNPLWPDSIADAIFKMISDHKNGIKRRYSNEKFTISNTLTELDKAFSEIRSIRFCWGSFDEIF